jgi:glycosyltransferase involved in cell wall biosynthesis
VRIGLITPGFSADESDWCIPALLDLVRELSSRHDVYVLTLRYPHQRRTYQVFGATVHSLGGATAGGLHRLPLLTRGLAAMRQAHRQAPFDVLHGLWADEPGFLAVSAGRLLGVPAVVSLLGGELVALPEIGYGGQLSRSNRWLTGQALRRAQVVTTGSELLREIATPYVSHGRLAVRPLGVDTHLFCPAQPDIVPEDVLDLAGQFKLLHVASLVPIKDQVTLLRSMALVAKQHPGVHLHVLGDGPLRASLNTEARALNVSEHVTFHGDVPHERLPNFYRAADLFVLSSRYESQSLVVLEAAACGCPAVGTAVGILPELLPPEHLAPVGDSPALAAAVGRLLEQPPLLADAGIVACRLANSRYSLSQTAPDFEALYRTLASSSSSDAEHPDDA